MHNARKPPVSVSLFAHLSLVEVRQHVYVPVPASDAGLELNADGRIVVKCLAQGTLIRTRGRWLKSVVSAHAL